MQWDLKEGADTGGVFEIGSKGFGNWLKVQGEEGRNAEMASQGMRLS